MSKFFTSNVDDTSTGTSQRRLSDSSHHEHGREVVKRGSVMRAVKNAMTPLDSASRRLEESCEEIEPLLSFAVSDFLSLNFDFGEFDKTCIDVQLKLSINSNPTCLCSYCGHLRIWWWKERVVVWSQI